jgi:hypothetical protein
MHPHRADVAFVSTRRRFESFGDRMVCENQRPMTDHAWLGTQRLPEVTVHASGALAQTIRAELRQIRAFVPTYKLPCAP